MYFGEKVWQVFKEIIKLMSLGVWVLFATPFIGIVSSVPLQELPVIEFIPLILAVILIGALVALPFGWFCRLFNAPPLSLLYKPNKNYGKGSSYERRVTTTHDVYDNSGSKVGTIKTDEGTETVYTEDTRKYVPRYSRMFFYFFYFPINRVLAVFFSVIALFTKKFYVDGGVLSLYMSEEGAMQCNSTLYTLFNIVYERSQEKVEKLKKKLEEEKSSQKAEK